MNKKVVISLIVFVLIITGVFLLYKFYFSPQQQVQTVYEGPMPPNRLPPLTLNRVPLSDFAVMPESQFKKVYGKLSYVGPKTKKIPSFPIVTGFDFDAIEAFDHGIGRFDNFRTPGIDYSADDPAQTYLVAEFLVIEPETFKEMMGHINGLPLSIKSPDTQNPYMSFAMLHTDKKLGFEIILNQNDSYTLATAMRESLKTTKPNWQILTRFACTADLLGDKRAIDVSDKVSVVTTPPRLVKELIPTKGKKATPSYESTATITNQSSQTITGPISLVVALQDEGIRGDLYLQNNDGTTCLAQPSGMYYLNVPLPDNSLVSGQSVKVQLLFGNLNDEQIRFTTRVLAGDGER